MGVAVGAGCAAVGGICVAVGATATVVVVAVGGTDVAVGPSESVNAAITTIARTNTSASNPVRRLAHTTKLLIVQFLRPPGDQAIIEIAGSYSV